MYELMLLGAALAGLSFLVAVHELGHLVAARWCRMAVDRFSVGFGPILARIRLGEVLYCLSALPLGGYVRILGEPGSGGRHRALVSALRRDRSLEEARALLARDRRIRYRPWYQQFALAAAGPLASLALGFLLFFGQTYVNGRVVEGRSDGVRVVGVFPNSGAERAGIVAGETILAINGANVHTIREIQKELMLNGTNSVAVTLVREGAVRELAVTPTERRNEVTRETMPELGVQLEVAPSVVEQVGVVGALADAAVQTKDTVAMQLRGLYSMVTGKVALKQVSGPVGIIHSVGVYATFGFGAFVAVLAVISIALGVMNLLPILPLDGGRMLFSLLHGLRGAPAPFRVQVGASAAGAVMLLALTVVGFVSDVSKLT